MRILPLALSDEIDTGVLVFVEDDGRIRHELALVQLNPLLLYVFVFTLTLLISRKIRVDIHDNNCLRSHYTSLTVAGFSFICD